MRKSLGRIASILVAAAILAVLALIVIPSAVDGPDSPPATPPPTHTPTAPPAPPETETPPPTESPDETPPPTLPPITGDRFSIMAPYGLETFAITANPDDFDHVTEETSDIFFYKPAGSYNVFIELSFFDDTSERRAPGFLQWYIPDVPDEQLGAQPISTSGVTGHAIRAKKDDGYSVDAWLVEVEGGFFSVVTAYYTPEQQELLYAMLGTLTLTR
jgi:hypothetical protein